MRGIALAALAAMFLLSSCGASTLTARGTAPLQLNDGTCTAPILLPGSSTLVIHVQVLGKALEDSVTVAPGQPFAFAWTVAAGSYQVRAWASLAAAPAYAGCDTTVTYTVRAAPWRPGLTP